MSVSVGNITVFGVETGTPLTPELIGGKGYSLIKMAQAGLKVPRAFILPTTYGARYLVDPVTVLRELADFISDALTAIDYAQQVKPLLSVRSGARVSMAGMMDTLLNVGLTPDTMDTYSDYLGQETAENCMKRLCYSYSELVLGKTPVNFSPAGDIDTAIRYLMLGQKTFPDRETQVFNACVSVLKSWNNDRAKIYRAGNNIPDDLGTAVIIQRMVFGNAGADSYTGVAFSRNTITGEEVLTGEILPDAQGEDVVGGTITPLPLSKLADLNSALYLELAMGCCTLENAYRDVVDVEFTIEAGTLYFLQCRKAKMTGAARLRACVDMASTRFSPTEALLTVKPQDIDNSQQDTIDESKIKHLLVYRTGIPACSGVVCAKMTYSPKEIMDNPPKTLIFITRETSPEHIAIMERAAGVITLRGGHTSHAAVVARGMNTPCIVGLNNETHEITCNIHGGSVLTMCGRTGRVWRGKVPICYATKETVINWARYFGNLQGVLVQEKPYHSNIGYCPTASQSVPKLVVLETGLSMAGVFWNILAAPHKTDAVVSEYVLPKRHAICSYGVVKHDHFPQIADLKHYLNHKGAATYTGEAEGEVSELVRPIITLKEQVYGAPVRLRHDRVASLNAYVCYLLQVAQGVIVFDKP